MSFMYNTFYLLKRSEWFYKALWDQASRKQKSLSFFSLSWPVDVFQVYCNCRIFSLSGHICCSIKNYRYMHGET